MLVLAGAEGHFCAGADLTTVEDDGFVAKLHDLLDGLRTAPFPTMAAVDGAALGAGTQLAVACDLRIATPRASFGIPAGKLGLMTDQWTVTRLADVAGQSVARAMLLAAETCSGERAHATGMVTRLAEPDRLVEDALAWAEQIARLAPLTLRGFKVGLNEAEGPLGVVARLPPRLRRRPGPAPICRRGWPPSPIAARPRSAAPDAPRPRPARA